MIPPATADAFRQVMDRLWIRNNVSFLLRYWHTAGEALERVAADPGSFAEFEDDDRGENYVDAVISSHLEHHNYSGILLAYAVFDEFMTSMCRRLGAARGAPIPPGDLRDRGVKRYKKFIHRVCGVKDQEVTIDWQLLEDFAGVRNAIIHANGNKSLLRNRSEMEAIVRRHEPNLSFKDNTKLVISDEFVVTCMLACRDTALAVNEFTLIGSNS